MPKKPSFQFYPGDWMKDPALGMCSPETRGIYIDLLCAMYESDTSGSITGTPLMLSRLCRCSEQEMTSAIDELAVTKTLRVTLCHKNITLENRRIKRESTAKENNRLRQAAYRSNVQCNKIVTSPSSSSTSLTKEKGTKRKTKTSTENPPDELWKNAIEIIARDTRITRTQAQTFLAGLAKCYGDGVVTEKVKALISGEPKINPRTWLKAACKGASNERFEKRDRVISEQDRIAAANPTEFDPSKGHLF